MTSTRRSSGASGFPAAGSSSVKKKTRNEAEEVDIAPAAAMTSPASGSLSRRRTRKQAVEVVVAPDVATASALVKDEEEGGDSTVQPNNRLATLRKRPVSDGMSPVAGSSSERPRRKMKKEAEAMASAAADEKVKVPLDEIKEEGDSLLRQIRSSQDMPRKRSSGVITSESELSLKNLRSKRKAGEEIVVPVVDEVTSDEKLVVEEDEFRFKEEGDDAEIVGGEEAVPKRSIVAVKKSTVDKDLDCRFIGEPIEEKEAKKRWPKRYQGKAKVK